MCFVYISLCCAICLSSTSFTLAFYIELNLTHDSKQVQHKIFMFQCESQIKSYDHSKLALYFCVITIIPVAWILIVWGWSGGAKVLGNLPVPGRPTNLDYSRARACCACSR